MFHVEVRQFPHQGRAFNLSRDELERRVLAPWLRGEVVELQDRRWSPERAKLTIYEGRGLELPEIGLGRGWANVTRTGQEVTDRVLAEAAHRADARPDLDEIKVQLLARAAGKPVHVGDVLDLVGPGTLQAELAREAVWQLLQEGRIALVVPEPS